MTNTLSVPGARLYYEVRGSGPVLLLVCGGIYDAAGYAGLAGLLADRYTVVSYDRRGNSRSPLDGPPGHQSIAVHGDDAHRVLDAVGVTADAPAYVFGNSSGAEIALELAARHPAQVRTVVAHEPPVFELLPDREYFRALLRDVEETFVAQGAGPALQLFTAGLKMGRAEQEDGHAPGGDGPQGAPDPEMAAMLARFAVNSEFFIGYETPFGGYVPDIAALRGSPVRVVPAAGADSAGEPPNRCAYALAELLDRDVAVFPGDHGGFGVRAVPFAATLHEVLSGA